LKNLENIKLEEEELNVNQPLFFKGFVDEEGKIEVKKEFLTE
jgi:hypothetical protein